MITPETLRLGAKPSLSRSRKFEAGFSLMESMVALVLLGITMLGVIQLFGVAIRQNSFARNNTMSLSVAQEKLEQLRTEFTNELEGGAVSTQLTAGAHPMAPAPSPEVVTRAAPAGSGVGDFTFNVTWNVTVAGTARTVAVTVAPAATDFESKTLSITAVFSP